MDNSDHNDQKYIKVSLNVHSEKEEIFWSTLAKLKSSKKTKLNDFRILLDSIYWEPRSIDLSIELLNKWWLRLRSISNKNSGLKDIITESFEEFSGGRFGFSLLRTIKLCIDWREATINKDDIEEKIRKTVLKRINEGLGGTSNIRVDFTTEKKFRINIPENDTVEFEAYIAIEGQPILLKREEDFNHYFPSYPIYLINPTVIIKYEIDDGCFILTFFSGYHMQGNKLIPGENASFDFLAFPLKNLNIKLDGLNEIITASTSLGDQTDFKSIKTQIARIVYAKISFHFLLLAEHTKYILVGYMLVSLEFLDSEEEHSNSKRNGTYHSYVYNSAKNLLLKSKF